MSRDELLEILKKENVVYEDKKTGQLQPNLTRDFYRHSTANMIRVYELIYNRAIDDVENLSYLSEHVLNEEQQYTRIIEERDLEKLRL
jgi:hypothetical protein